MRLGATLAHLSQAPPFAVAEWARRLVDDGFESLWIPQVIGRGFLVPDPFVTLAVAATATEGVEVGTATVQVPLHHPADLAYRILSLVSVCGDRLTLGVSPGSTEIDFATFDRNYAARFTPPSTGRYVGQPPRADEEGVRELPPPVPDPLPKVVAGVAVAAGAAILALARRR